jgi:ubiquinone/menaquinone biosynthesis C-methylase UbiE
MVNPDRTQKEAWDREYAKPDPLWKGPSRDGTPSVQGKRVLEMGCGNGKTTAALVRSAETVVAIDYSRKGLEACHRTLTAPNLLLMEADVRYLPFIDASFDQVVAFHILGHLLKDGRKRAVEEAYRVLRPGGELFVRMFSHQDMRCGSGKSLEVGTFAKGTGIPCHYFDADELSDLFRDFRTVVQDEIRTEKRYDGIAMFRAEWVGSYRRP